tara:strand:- start:289 stop:534 length:246 start_codon:yes stop_codon:yes gene_type:complete
MQRNEGTKELKDRTAVSFSTVISPIDAEAEAEAETEATTDAVLAVTVIVAIMISSTNPPRKNMLDKQKVCSCTGVHSGYQK